MLNIAIEHGTGAREVGRYRVADARPTDGAVVRTGAVAQTGAVARTGVVAGTLGVAAGTPGTDARQVTRYRVETARPTDGEGKTQAV